MKTTITFGAITALSLLAGAVVLGGAHAQEQESFARAESSPISRMLALRQEAETERVIGGREAAQGAYPFQVALLASFALDEGAESQTGANFCGGSLIAPGWVLTAAHCLFDFGEAVPAHVVTVLTGATSLDEGTRHEVAEVIVHPDYDEFTLDADVALLRLATPSDQPVIGLTARDAEAGPATVIGWGMTETGAFPVNLMEADIELTGNAACNDGIKQIYARDLGRVLQYYAGRMRYSPDGIDSAMQAILATMRDPLTGNMLCAGLADGARDACKGDSGGPLFTTIDGQPVQVGVVSWGEGPMDAATPCGHANAYGVYTRLANYTGWIAGYTGN